MNVAVAKPENASKYVIAETIDLAEVPSDLRVGFCLLTTPESQYAAYYDRERNMVVAARSLGSKDWQYHTLPSKVGWDSHNYVTMALDPDGHLHVSGNMHCVELVYFRTKKPGDITTLQKATMTGELENRVTYPQFLHDHASRLIFTYRHGGSGNGINIYNRYDTVSRTWSRLMSQPLFDGEGQRNAYPTNPVRGPDGKFHVTWVWRDTPDCATNQHLSYARSPDLTHWESVFGEKIELPIRFGHDELLVDPVPIGGGIINGGHRLIFDSKGRPVIGYHKSDAAGNMQLYAARPSENGWERHVLTEWEKPVDFSGNGSMGFIGIRIAGFAIASPGVLAMDYRHKDYGSGSVCLDEKSLRPIHVKRNASPKLPRELFQLESDFPGMTMQRFESLGSYGNNGVRYLLKWETLESNRDRRPEPPLPPPGMLKLHKLVNAK
ncbi:MAG TPA: BNR repeat-containing protein [Luteolibacter sp.]|nr:BNR repeat-containing protein [Luteolibacter sp.]